MKPSILKKLQNLITRSDELKELLSDPKVTQDINRYRDLSKEYSQIEPYVRAFLQYHEYAKQLEESKAMLSEDDPEMHALARAEIETIEEAMAKLEADLLVALIPKDPQDDNNIFLEIRAGTGGDEAAIFAGDLSRMYMRYAESQRFQIEIISESHGEHGGYKEIIMRVLGQGAFSRFKFESGVHRVQRVPDTEAQGRIHTSTCTIAVLLDIAEIESIDLNPADLRIDTFRASGAGGQHV